MSFAAVEFWLFLPIVLALFRSVRFSVGKLVLLAASYFFYMWWSPWLVSLILLSTAVDYYVGLALGDAEDGLRRRRLLLLSLVTNLGLLGFFKYYNFFASSIAGVVGIEPGSVYLDIALPIGISFYTFQTLSYTIDVYRRRMAPIRRFSDFALFVAFFPQLVAGPIIRATEFFPQLYDWRGPDEARLHRGVFLIAVGLVKKLVFADQFAVLSDAYFADVAGNPGLLAAWTGAAAFGLQVFFDFSGYSDIARGCGKLLGFELPVNFQRPYLAPDISEFWRRWHATLGQWFRDYVYIPMGGSRYGTMLTVRNLIVSMGLLGFWHGANWNFIWFGVCHGVFLAAHRGIRRLRPADSPRSPDPIGVRELPIHALKVLCTVGLFTFSLSIFRAEAIPDTGYVMSQMFGSQLGESMFGPGHVFMIVVATLISIAEERSRLLTKVGEASNLVRLAFYVGALTLLLLFSVENAGEAFFYFQF